MKCSLPQLWLGMSLAASLLTCGCQHTRECPASCMCPPTSSSMISYKPPSAAPGLAARPAPEQGNPLTARSDSSVLHTTAKPAPLSLDTVPANSSTAAAAPSADSAAPKNLSQAETAAPRPNADLASQTHYSHDPSYHRLVGVLEHSRIQNAWTLRYASVEDEDRYGGSVTLEGLGPMTGFKNRQTVRVEGRLINPDSQQIRPAFEVEAIHRIGP